MMDEHEHSWRIVGKRKADQLYYCDVCGEWKPVDTRERCAHCGLVVPWKSTPLLVGGTTYRLCGLPRFQQYGNWKGDPTTRTCAYYFSFLVGVETLTEYKAEPYYAGGHWKQGTPKTHVVGLRIPSREHREEVAA